MIFTKKREILTLFTNAFPFIDADTILSVLSNLPLRADSNVNIISSEQKIRYFLNGVNIELPYRFYLVDITDETANKLSEVEKTILHCIYSRSNNGYVREKHIKKLLDSDYPDWAIPYIFKVCDEYVVEILDTVYACLHDNENDKIKQFCIENSKSFCHSYNRMISYWNEFYRNDYFHYKDYIGRKLFIECFGYSRSIEKNCC